MQISEILSVSTIPDEARSSYSFDSGVQRAWIDTMERLSDGKADELKKIPFELLNRNFVCGFEVRHFFFSKNRLFKKEPIMLVQMVEFQDGYQIENVRIDPAYRGKSLALKAYVAISDWTGGPLYSGPNQTQDSAAAIWAKLFQMYPNRVVAYDQKERVDLPLKMTSKGLVARDKEQVYNPINHVNSGFIKDQVKRSKRTRLLKFLPTDQEITESILTEMYTAYQLSKKSRAEILSKFPPKFSDVRAHHVTVKFGVPKDQPKPHPAKIQVVGYATDDSGIEAVVCSVNGKTTRPDGGTYHVTLSHGNDRKSSQSNGLLANGWTPVEPFDIDTTPEILK